MSESSSIPLISVIYVAGSLFLIVPPQELKSAGLTLENICWKLLGSEQSDFVGYHLRRTALNVAVHSLLPLGYLCCLAYLQPDLQLQAPWNASTLVQIGLAVSLAIAACSLLVVFWWSRQNWSNHPFARVLRSHGETWRAAALSINVEYRRFDKFTSGDGEQRLIVTNSWVISTGIYRMKVARQGDVHLTLVGSKDLVLPENIPTTAQRLSIQVSSINKAVQPFDIHLNSLEYRDLKAQLHVPIVNVRGIIVQQTLSERFVQAFMEQVNRNPPYYLPRSSPELDPCIGCMLQQPDAKLVKWCAEVQDGDCQSCQCRPQWCLTCVAKWFASRQDQRQPETWLSSKAPCPTCRSKFCMLDVCRVQLESL